MAKGIDKYAPRDNVNEGQARNIHEDDIGEFNENPIRDDE